MPSVPHIEKPRNHHSDWRAVSCWDGMVRLYRQKRPGQTTWNRGSNKSGPLSSYRSIPDQIGEAETPQLCRQGDQVIVVHPHEIVWHDKLRKRHCKCAINSQVATVVGT
jgi:hypothetical protein